MVGDVAVVGLERLGHDPRLALHDRERASKSDRGTAKSHHLALDVEDPALDVRRRGLREDAVLDVVSDLLVALDEIQVSVDHRVQQRPEQKTSALRREIGVMIETVEHAGEVEGGFEP